MHVAVRDHPPAAPLLESGVGRDPPVELDHPGIVSQVELSPIAREGVLGEVALADGRDVRRGHELEDVGKVGPPERFGCLIETGGT